MLKQERELERTRIVGETAKIPWLDLQRFFATGKVMWVAAELDLVDVACALQQDDLQQVKIWTEAQQLAPVSNVQALSWVDADALLWSVVIKPWVLVQEVTSAV
ncbi:MAG: DUF2288 domain-containing protein [Gammaproteobacteria bacterium]|nr:DUF2288 domain-containing protein [Gammaproteobacteria bacterium]